jgi:prepilin-type N-terminal cleavage/methylation domain-containing protein
MKIKIWSNQSGLTLVELLSTLAIGSLISIILFSNLFSGMNSYKRVNNQISLHDEGNYVMTQFVNIIYVALKVDVLYPPKTAGSTGSSVETVDPCKSVIRITRYKENKLDELESITLGFDRPSAIGVDPYAEINYQNILPSAFSIVCNDTTKPSIEVHDSTVFIEMTIQNDETGEQLELKNNVSYVNIGDGN